MLDTNTLLTGIAIFLARICDVSLGTIRTIITVQGRSVIAFFLAIFEILIWIAVVSTVVQKAADHPILAVFYALGFATGNIVGIAVERKIALGFMVLRVFTRTAGKSLTERLRTMGQPVTACGDRWTSFTSPAGGGIWENYWKSSTPRIPNPSTSRKWHAMSAGPCRRFQWKAAGGARCSSANNPLWQGVEKQASGRQPRRTAFWKAQHIRLICEHLQKPHNAGSRP
jgi:hypothetical protein